MRYLATFLCVCAASAVLAEELEPNRLYAGGTTIEVSELGLSITIPEGWKGALPQGSSMFIMESSATNANTFLYGDEMTDEELREVMSATIPLDAQLSLEPTSGVREESGWFVADYCVPQNAELEARIKAQTGPSGIGLAMITVAKKGDFASAWSATDRIARSLTFREPAVPPSNAGNWQDYMRGRYVVRLYTGSGYYEEEHIWLCSNGQFIRSSNAGGGGVGSGASGAYAGRGQGAWRADGDLDGNGTLVLRYGATSFEGSTSDFSFQQQTGAREVHYTLRLSEDDKLYLDGKRWFRDQNQRCR